MATLIENVGTLVPMLLTLMLAAALGVGVWLLFSLRRSARSHLYFERSGKSALFYPEREVFRQGVFSHFFRLSHSFRKGIAR